jgi:predicted acyl esterase
VGGAQPWSNGKVGLNGISYYAMNQWQVAALQPPHLAAICIWEAPPTTTATSATTAASCARSAARGFRRRSSASSTGAAEAATGAA